MFGKLPEFFDRSFAVAYFLPFSAFLSANIGILREFGYFHNVLTITAVNQVSNTSNTNVQLNILIGTTVLGLISWFGGIILLATNRDIIRLLEGYGQFNPLRTLSFIEKAKFRSMKSTILKLDQEYLKYIKSGETFPLEKIHKRNELMQKSVQRFPDQERWLLPTSFGNTIRAFEVYPRVMYGLDSIPGWSRLLSVIPEDYRSLIDDSKVNVDFWVNICFLSIIFILEYFYLSISAGQANLIWVPFMAIFVVILSYVRAESSSVEWGDMVKSAFDVYLPDLGKKLSFEESSSTLDANSLWSKFSQAIIYGDPEFMPNRNRLNDDNECK